MSPNVGIKSVNRKIGLKQAPDGVMPSLKPKSITEIYSSFKKGTICFNNRAGWLRVCKTIFSKKPLQSPFAQEPVGEKISNVASQKISGLMRTV
jgi:hypothetical protein